MGLRDIFRRHDDAMNAVPDAGSDAEHVHDHDGCGPVGPPVPAEAPAQRVAPAADPGDAVLLRSFPFKLALLQPLMYEPGAILPAFRMPASMHPGRPVEDWFRGFTLTADQLAHVTSVTLGRGSEVYRQVDPHWTADDDRFDVTGLTDRDIAAVPNLRTVADPELMLAPAARASLAAAGIAVL